jgi:hypothetical protein
MECVQLAGAYTARMHTAMCLLAGVMLFASKTFVMTWHTPGNTAPTSRQRRLLPYAL